jgi:hypothetical protein
MRIAATLSPFLILKRLREDGSAATLNRLGASQHVADLRLMFSSTVSVVLVGIICALVFGYWHIISDNWRSQVAGTHNAWPLIRLFGDAVVSIGPFVGALIALGCGIVGWAYQAGSARLGIVDLFACEVSTICRVCAITDIAQRYVDAFNADLCADGPPNVAAVQRVRHAFNHFDATENYTPVFEKNASDLRVLDVKVVTNVTAFYTYFKAMRDTLRTMTSIEPAPVLGNARDAWHDALKNVIYMMFLAFESVRKAVRDLIEFDPNQVESTINILINELTAYHFLLQQFGSDDGTDSKDFRYARLKLRLNSYREIVGRTYWRAIDGKESSISRANQKRQKLTALSPAQRDSVAGREKLRSVLLDAELARQWAKAAETAHELENRYVLLFPDEKIPRPAVLLAQAEASKSAAPENTKPQPAES